tara:strand:- start:303 stop:518 length:216 start_codon:yes stop_codon:yes gene_type:complete
MKQLNHAHEVMNEMSKSLIDKKEETLIDKYFCCFNKRNESITSDDLPTWANNDDHIHDGKIKKKILTFSHH